MNQKTLIRLVVAAVVLAIIYFLTVSRDEPRAGDSEHRLLDGIGSEAVGKIELEQGSEKVELVFKDGQWRVPARGDYQADGSKIRAFLLKLFDMEISQRLPADEKSAERLGVSAESVKRGMGYIKLADGSGRTLAGIRLGEARRGKDKTPASPTSGQYVRRDDQEEVYLVGTPVSLTVAPESWIDVNLINILPSSIEKVLQAKRSAESEELLFELMKSDEKDTTGQPVLKLKTELPPGKNLQEPIVTQVRSALENFRIADVRVASSPETKDLNFDFLTKYSTSAGLVYSIETAEKDQKSYVRLRVAFDAELAQALKEEAEKAAPAAAPTPNGDATPQPTSSPAPSPKKPELKLSSAEEANKLNADLEKWVFEVPAYNARKLRFTMSELTEPPPPPPKPEGGEFMPNVQEE